LGKKKSREKEPVGGAARFISKIKEFDSEDPLVLFSGDCFSPSICKFYLIIFIYFFEIQSISQTRNTNNQLN